MTQHLIDAGSVRAELRALSRGSLLVIAERAAELVPEDQLRALLGDFVNLETSTAKVSRAQEVLLGDVREFYDAAMAEEYYETVEINNRGPGPTGAVGRHGYIQRRIRTASAQVHHRCRLRRAFRSTGQL